VTYSRHWIHEAIVDMVANHSRIPSTDIIRIMMSMCPEKSPTVIDATFKRACGTGSVKVMEAILEGMDDLNAPLNEMHLPLAMAICHAKANATDIVGAVLDAGADINISLAADLYSLGPKLITPIEVAMRHRRLDIIKFLILSGATLPSEDRWPDHKKMREVLHVAKGSYRRH
jgi:ankyrin repeat protein